MNDALNTQVEIAASWRGGWAGRRSADIATVLTRFEELIPRSSEEVRGPVHGDWGCNNILVDDGQVSALLDWETSGIGDPIHDIAGRFWAFWPPVATCVGMQAADSDGRLAGLADYHSRILCGDLRTGLSEIGAALGDGDVGFADRLLDRCLEMVSTSPA